MSVNCKKALVHGQASWIAPSELQRPAPTPLSPLHFSRRRPFQVLLQQSRARTEL